MAGLKTKRTSASVTEFLREVDDKQKLADCRAIAKMMLTATGKRAKMWGASIVGFGSYDYLYETGDSETWPKTGFSPRAQNVSIYIMPGFSGIKSLLSQLGKYKSGKSCRYITRLDDVDKKVLQKLITESVKDMRRRYKNN